MTPTRPSGYVTAQLRAAPAEGWPSCLSVCCAAPRAGVLVVAPQSTPIMSESGDVPVHAGTRASSVPSTTTENASRLSDVPPLRKVLMKPGPTCRPRA